MLIRKREAIALVRCGMVIAGLLATTSVFAMEVVPWTTMIRRDVVMQEEELSCGAAATAMIAQLLYLDKIEEKDVLAVLDGRAKGLSANASQLVDAAEKLGYSARALALDFGALAKLELPVILFLKPPLSKIDIGHFVVLIKVTPNGVYYKDPTYGNRVVDTATFRTYWETRADPSAPGIVIAILPKTEAQRSTAIAYRAPAIRPAQPMSVMR